MTQLTCRLLKGDHVRKLAKKKGRGKQKEVSCRESQPHWKATWPEPVSEDPSTEPPQSSLSQANGALGLRVRDGPAVITRILKETWARETLSHKKVAEE